MRLTGLVSAGVGAMALLAGPALAQDVATTVFQQILQASRLPTVTKEARTLGVPESDLQGIFRTARDQRIPAGSLVDLFSAENEEIRRHGPIDNFGSFVQGRLAAGLRGRELAAAIHAEHGQRGMDQAGHGRSMKAVGSPGTMNPPGHAGDDHGKPASPGKSGDNGKSGENGKSGDNGKSGENGKKGDR